MPDRLQVARDYMAFQRNGKFEEAAALLADDAVLTNPMVGTVTGKEAALAQMRNRPAGGGAAGITWREPTEADGGAKVVGDGSPFGTVRVLFAFDEGDKITKVDIGLGS